MIQLLYPQILDSFTLFTVLVLSYIFLKARYLIIHLMGVALAVIGIFSLVLVDFDSPHNEAGQPFFFFWTVFIISYKV